ncbi:MAG: hypothetical protein MN733_20280, partial [Nitrososphaera sp.]|nr:hypothetical protein [Nitrososphaera sp.]
MSDAPEEVKIKLKHGDWEVEITCVESRVKQVVENVLSSLDTSKLVSPAIQEQLDSMRRDIELVTTRSIASEAQTSSSGGEQKAKSG